MHTTRLSEGDADRPTLVCLPGAMCSPRVFEQAALRSGLPAVALAWLEGGGAHDLQSVAERVCDELAERPSVILVGHSMGTPIAILTALLSARRGNSPIKGLVLSNSGANTRGHGDIASLVGRIEQGWSQAFREAFTARCFHTLPAEPLLEEVRGYPCRLDRHAVIQALLSQQAIDCAPLLASLPRVPTAIVHGVHDPARTLAHARELADGISGATLHVLDTGHTSCAEDPAAFAEVLRTITV